eukprot:7476390-Alexandrium_andersonii.AAC.1
MDPTPLARPAKPRGIPRTRVEQVMPLLTEDSRQEKQHQKQVVATKMHDPGARGLYGSFVKVGAQ